MLPAPPAGPTPNLVPHGYAVQRLLSRGGMGAVYLATQLSLGREVAVKVLLTPDPDEDLRQRFDVEARAVCQLNHPNIITYYDFGHDEHGRPYLVMEYLDGYSATRLMQATSRAPIIDVVRVLLQVCSALNEAHAKGIVHRDLKWSNIMVCPQTHNPLFTKLIDFGIVKVLDPGALAGAATRTTAGMLLGTPAYMSPEAIRGGTVDGRADIYALGVMLWEAVEGHPPFMGSSRYEVLRRHSEERPPPFRVGRPYIATNHALADVIDCAMQKDPNDRFATAAALQSALVAAVPAARILPSTVGVPTRPSDQQVTALALPSVGAPNPNNEPHSFSSLLRRLSVPKSQSVAPWTLAKRASVPASSPPQVDPLALRHGLAAERASPNQRSAFRSPLLVQSPLPAAPVPASPTPKRLSPARRTAVLPAPAFQGATASPASLNAPQASPPRSTDPPSPRATAVLPNVAALASPGLALSPAASLKRPLALLPTSILPSVSASAASFVSVPASTSTTVTASASDFPSGPAPSSPPPASRAPTALHRSKFIRLILIISGIAVGYLVVSWMLHAS